MAQPRYSQRLIRVISFDLDQTLWDFRSAMRRALTVCLGRLRAEAPQASEGLTVERMVAIRDEVAEELRGHETNLERIRLAAFVRTLAFVGITDDDLAQDLNRLYLDHRFRGDLYEDSLQVLKVLQRDYTLGIVSNGNSYPRTLGLEGLFAFTVFSQDHGVEKPDVRIFEIAAALADAEPHEIVHVGDSIVTDVVGAQEAGWRAILIDRVNASDLDGVTPDAVISSLVELPDVLMAWGGGVAGTINPRLC